VRKFLPWLVLPILPFHRSRTPTGHRCRPLCLLPTASRRWPLRLHRRGPAFSTTGQGAAAHRHGLLLHRLGACLLRHWPGGRCSSPRPAPPPAGGLPAPPPARGPLLIATSCSSAGGACLLDCFVTGRGPLVHYHGVRARCSNLVQSLSRPWSHPLRFFGGN
jgi:hypothetical protein